MWGYWWIWLPSQNQILKVGPFLERIFQANFRFGVEISNFQLLGCVKAEKLSFLEGWFFVCGYWWIWLPSHVRFSKVGPFSERIFQANFRFGVQISRIQLLGCLKAANLSFLEGWFFVCGYSWVWLPSHVQFFKVGPFFVTIFQAGFKSTFLKGEVCSF